MRLLLEVFNVKPRLTLSLILLCAFRIGAQISAVNSYTQTNLSSDIPEYAATLDPNLRNPWGLSRPNSSQLKENEWWAADQVTGVSTLYDANGAVVPLTITIPSANGASVGSPAGTVYSSRNFVFATLDGTISQWTAATAPTGGANSLPKGTPHPANTTTCTGCHVTYAVLEVNHAGASYQGITIATYNGTPAYYVANSNGGIEAYDSNYNPVSLPPGAFSDINIPAGFTPANVQAAGGRIYVTYNAPNNGGNGYVDAFTTAGTKIVTLQQGSWFNQPWGVVQAPSNFGALSKLLLVGNTGSGLIAAFNPSNGKFAGFIKDSAGTPIANPGLWGLSFGDGNTQSGPTNVLYFNAGIQNNVHGLFGAIASNN